MKIEQILLMFVLVFLVSCRDRDDNSGVALTGSWEIKEFMSIESVLYAKDDDYNPFVEFNADGSYDLYLDKNGCFGSFELGDDKAISISVAGCTEMCCDSDFSIKAATMLSQVETYVVQGNDLELHVPGWGWLVLKKVAD